MYEQFPAWERPVVPEYFQPTELSDALDLLRSDDVAVVAGGTDFFPARGRTPVRSHMLDLTRVRGLRGLHWTDEGTLRIGAATTWTDVVEARLPAAFHALQQAAAMVGGVQIQNTGTIAGNICNASPAADGVPPLLALDAAVEIAGPAGLRTMPLGSFLTGVRKTALAPSEIVTAILVRKPPEHCTSAFNKLGARKYLVISISMVAAVIGVDQAGKIDVARIAVGACSAVAQRLPALEVDLIGKRLSDVTIETIEPRHLQQLSPITDVRADAVYRVEAARRQVHQTIQAAIGDG